MPSDHPIQLTPTQVNELIKITCNKMVHVKAKLELRELEEGITYHVVQSPKCEKNIVVFDVCKDINNRKVEMELKSLNAILNYLLDNSFFEPKENYIFLFPMRQACSYQIANYDVWQKEHIALVEVDFTEKKITQHDWKQKNYWSEFYPTLSTQLSDKVNAYFSTIESKYHEKQIINPDNCGYYVSEGIHTYLQDGNAANFEKLELEMIHNKQSYMQSKREGLEAEQFVELKVDETVSEVNKKNTFWRADSFLNFFFYPSKVDIEVSENEIGKGMTCESITCRS